MSHTQGKLSISEIGVGFEIQDQDGNVLFQSQQVPKDSRHDRRIANARRLVACWNACDGISTEELEAGFSIGLIRTIRSRNAVERQRDELLFALIDLLPDAISNHIGGADTQARIDAARNAIAKSGVSHEQP